jgi:universal stress protein A
MKRIVCPTDFSTTSEAAIAEAERLASSVGAELVLLHVAVEAPLWREGLYTPEVRKVFDSQRKWAAAALETRAAALAGNGVRARVMVKSGLPWRQIIDTAREEDVDLIVIGTHGRGGLNRMLLGSVAERVVRQAPCPVMTVGPQARPTRGSVPLAVAEEPHERTAG